jgi:hypothetical protein
LQGAMLHGHRREAPRHNVQKTPSQHRIPATMEAAFWP